MPLRLALSLRSAPLTPALILAAALAGCGDTTGTSDGPAADLSAAADLAAGPDLTSGRDLAQTMDLAKTIDMAQAADLAQGSVTQVTVGPGTVFVPAQVTVKVGGTVRWTWAANNHNVVSGTGGTADNKFCSPSNTNCTSAPLSNAGTVYEFKFTQAGSFPYFCKPHAGAGMVGTITVQP